MELKFSFLNLEFKNPITVGAGTFGYGKEIKDFIDPSLLGAVVVKGTSLNPWAGNPPPRMCETPSGMLNSIGLQNEGLDHFVMHKIPALKKIDTKIIVGIFDKTVENYVKIARVLDQTDGVDALELNLSCPNIEAGGATFCSTPLLMREVIREVRKAVKKVPLIAKLSPNVTDIVEIAYAAMEEGADALTIINTVVGMSIDIHSLRPRLSTNTGGLSGPAIHPIAVANLWKVRRALPTVPIIGVGGVHDIDSALQLILAGANVVGVGTANFYNPGICLEILRGLKDYCQKNDIENISELVGAVKAY